MDQDAFRSMLSSSSSSSHPRRAMDRNMLTLSARTKTISASEPAFKPRKMKKDGKYRDRAAERRVGEGNDFAQVEALLEDFNEQTANDDKDAAAEKRRYLGGDSEHTVLVKGLDFALLEQNKAKATVSPTDDDDLEHAFIEVPKKRTREELVRQLREKRAKEATPTSDAPITTNSKFKPIGFKPIDEGTKTKKKKLKIVDGDKKKKSKVDPVPSEPDPPSASVPPPPKPQPIQEPEPPDDFDIFADAGEYKGLDVGDDDDSDEDVAPADTAEQPTLGARPGHWFDEPSKSPEPATSASESRSLPPRVPLPTDDDGGQEEDADVPMRLVPLEGSSVPSIKELLALDQAVGSADKKRKRKEKNKGKKDDSEGANKASTEAKVDRDYKRLKSYQEKQAASK
ncbi:RED-like protein N-terminal region-domain-containing protein [Mucidula mucida]|nr:RED-like protein N-terminal region-domain-containing protein [Mucidula mucida]